MLIKLSSELVECADLWANKVKKQVLSRFLLRQSKQAMQEADLNLNLETIHRKCPDSSIARNEGLPGMGRRGAFPRLLRFRGP